jgi:DNA-binding Lrp family transcriptional regulator
LLNEPEIKEVYPLFGEYSFLAKIEATDINTIQRIVLGKIRSITGVIATETLLETKISIK